jgi:AcrR family transcriptional regulator
LDADERPSNTSRPTNRTKIRYNKRNDTAHDHSSHAEHSDRRRSRTRPTSGIRQATEAGISRATFYVYFENKGQLLRELARQVFGELSEGAHQWWDTADRHDPEDARGSMASISAIYRRHQTLVTAVIETAAYDPDVAEFYQQMLDAIIGNTEAVIERGKADGLIRATLPTRETASGLTWLVERTVHQTARFTPPEQDGALAQALSEIIWSTLYLEPATKPS